MFFRRVHYTHPAFHQGVRDLSGMAPGIAAWGLMTGVAMWDVAVERQVEVSGPDADKLAQYLSARDLSSMKVGQGKYVAMCDHQGRILNDPLHHVSGQFLAATGLGVVDRLKEQAIGLAPLRSACLQPGRLNRRQAHAQVVGKEMMIAVPMPLVIERNQEQVGVLECFQGFMP